MQLLSYMVRGEVGEAIVMMLLRTMMKYRVLGNFLFAAC